jgi:hypothetical protein
MSEPQLPFENLICALVIAATAASCIEETDIYASNIANIVVRDEYVPILSPIDQSTVRNTEFNDITLPRSMRGTSIILLCFLTSPVLFGNNTFLGKTFQTSVVVLLLATVVAVSKLQANRITRLSEAAFVFISLWVLAFVNAASASPDSRRNFTSSVFIYLGLLLIRASFAACELVPEFDVQRDTSVIAGCHNCDAFLSACMSAAGAACTVSSIWVRLNNQDNKTSHWRMLYLSSSIIATAYVASLIAVGNVIVHNPAYLPLRAECEENIEHCSTEPTDDPRGRRNTITIYASATFGLVTVAKIAETFELATISRSRRDKHASTLAFEAVVVGLCACFIVGVYFGLMSDAMRRGDLPHMYAGSGDTFKGIWLIDVALCTYVVGIGLTFFMPLLGIGVMQLSIAIELVRVYVEYGAIVFFSYYTMLTNVVLCVVVFVALVIAKRTLWVEWLVLVARSIAFCLLLAYICGFCIVNGQRAEKVVSVTFDTNEDIIYNSAQITMLSIRSGARSIILHYAPVPIVALLAIQTTPPVSASLSLPDWKWAIQRRKRLAYTVWFFSSIILLCSYLAIVSQDESNGVPDSYPIDDYLLTALSACAILLVPFAFAL